MQPLPSVLLSFAHSQPLTLNSQAFGWWWCLHLSMQPPSTILICSSLGVAVVSASEYAATIRHPLLVPTTTKGGRQAGKAAPETPTPETPTPETPTRQAGKRQVSGLQSDASGCKGEKAYASGCKGMQAKKQGGRG